MGAGPTIAILLADSLLGALLLRYQGRSAWRRLNSALAERRMPHREVLDGALIVFGGALLLTPGFLTDAVGFALLLPPTRALARRSLTSYLSRRIARGSHLFFGARTARQPRPYDIDGTADDISDKATFERMLKK